MLKKIIAAFFVILASGCTSQAQQPDPGQVYAWYREDGIQMNGNKIAAWNSASAIGGAQGGGRALSRVVGAPRALKVKTPGGEKSIVSFDGSAALWARKEEWKEIGGDVTIIAFLRLRDTANGFLFDGSAGPGLTRAQVRDNQWQIGVQPSAPSATTNASRADSITNAAQKDLWQTHAFVFRKSEGSATHSVGGNNKTVTLNSNSGLSGFILGENGAAKMGLRVDVAELVIYDRALTGDELAGFSKYLNEKWGKPEIAGNTSVAAADKTAIAAKLADKTKPILWLWAGHNDNEKTLGSARDVPQHFAERVRWELQRRRDIVMDTRTLQPEDLVKNFDARVERFHPTVVVLDLNEGDNASELINKVRKIGAIPIVTSGAQQSASLRKATAEEGAVLVESTPLAAGGNAEASQVAVNDAVALMRALDIDDPKSSVDKLLKP
jgi:hypothetical protein